MALEELIGSRLVFGIPGTTITPEIIQHFKDTHCGGLILYRINFESPDQVRKLISDLESALGRRLLVCTDHEGGRVVMFGDGVTVFPSQQAFGETGNSQLVHRQAEQEGRELRRLGIDVNFAPVLDVLTDVYSPNIGIRAYGKDPELVAKMGAARIAALQVAGVSACAKHFPGLGPANLDPHLQLPSINVNWQDLERVHMIPFYRAMRTGVHSIMTSHPLYPQLDPTPKTPATFSRKIVHDYLRKGTGYKGVIFSDDLEMGAVTELAPIGEAAVLAAHAGHDGLLVCHGQDAQKKVYGALLEAYRTKRLDNAELEESAERMRVLLSRRSERFEPLPATPARAEREKADVRALVQEIGHVSISVLSEGPALSNQGTTAVIFPRLSDLAARIMIEKDEQNEKAFLDQRLRALGLTPEIIVLGIDPGEHEIQSAVAAAVKASQAILFLFDAHLHPASKTLLETLQHAAPRLAVVLLRDAYDVEFVKAGTLCLTNFGFRICDIEAVLQKLFASAGVPAH